MKNQQEITTLYVNPVPRISAQGRHKQMFHINTITGEPIPTVAMQKNKEFGVPSVYCFQKNPLTNKLQTGLNTMIPNPFHGLEPEYVVETYSLSQDWLAPLASIVKQEQIKLQTKFEILDNVPIGRYTDEIRSGNLFTSTSNIKPLQEPSFLETFNLILYDQPNRFTDETPRGRLAIALIKVHNKIAKSKQEMNTSIHDWYVSEEAEAQIEKTKKREVIENAIAAWVGLKSNSTPYQVYQLATMLTNSDGKNIVKGKMKDSTVKENISDYINDTHHQMENIEKFNKLYDLLQVKEGRQKFYIMYLIQQALNTNVIGIRDGFYVWHSKSGTPNMYKHPNYDKLVSLLQQEYNSYNVDDKTVTNWYKDLMEEVSSKGVWIE